MKRAILIVEDEPDIRKTLRQIVEGEGYAARTADSGEDALAELRKSTPDLVLLDVKLPGMDGFALCRKLRETPEWRELPVIFLTSKAQETNKVLGFELGADDYVVKPFGAAELLARVKNALRHRPAEQAEAGADLLAEGPLSIDKAGRTARLAGEPLRLTPTQFDLLCLLILKKGKALSRTYIMERVWGREYEATTRTIDTHVYNLRKTLGEIGARIKAVGATGYKWE